MNLSERDHNLIWHPFTHQQTAAPNIAITHGKGALLYDEHGNEYIDAVSSWWTNLFGHANPEIAEAVKKQLDTLEHVIFAGFTHQPAIELSEKLINLLPSTQSRVFFSDNGSTCVEVALKMAIQYWHNQSIEKTTIIAFKNAYHGDTFGAMSVGARGVFNRPFESYMFEVVFVDLPTDDNFEQVLADFTRIVQRNKTVAFIFEPLIQGSAGMLLYKAEYLDKLLEIAQQHEVICIADEVMTGFGRTGKTFASDYLQHKPDIFCLSKGITGGFLPLGVTTCTQQIYEAFLSEDKLKTFFHGHSYTGNPLACAAANASLGLMNNAQLTINDVAKWQTEFSSTLKEHPKIVNLRQIGTIVAFEVKTDADYNLLQDIAISVPDDRVKNTTPNYFNDLRDFLYGNFIQRGVLLRPLGNTVYILPPYIITKEQLQRVYEVIGEVLGLL
ncbi:MAG: adenosylmethionine--8-amino-7-oxononanoate transaminase [Chitinophagales bacterium]|nr:adenosylmethionine--8-amino-7-oxononanoate transaminase [Chitinophagales bacterium]